VSHWYDAFTHHHHQGDRDKLSNQSDSLQPPGGAAWGKRHNVITLSPQKGTNQHTRMPQNEASSQGSVRDQIATEQGTSKATTAAQGHGLTWVTLHAVKCSDVRTVLDKANHQGKQPRGWGCITRQEKFQKLELVLPSYLFLVACHQAHPAADHLRLSTGNRITWPPAWPPWGAPTLAATQDRHRAIRANWDGLGLCCITAHPPGLAQGLYELFWPHFHLHSQIS
jgi:hypothetical protein